MIILRGAIFGSFNLVDEFAARRCGIETSCVGWVSTLIEPMKRLGAKERASFLCWHFTGLEDKTE